MINDRQYTFKLTNNGQNDFYGFNKNSYNLCIINISQIFIFIKASLRYDVFQYFYLRLRNPIFLANIETYILGFNTTS